ncbi:MAG: glycosyltransferase family 4 protein [Legionella sp.]
MNKRLLLVVNTVTFFISHRLEIAKAAQKNGYEIHIAAPRCPKVQFLYDQGFIYHELSLSRSGKNIFAECKVLFVLYRLFKQLSPLLVHLITIKPAIYGGIAARLARVGGVVIAVSGLGFIYITDDLKAKLLRSILTRLYRFIFAKKNLRILFQNPADRDILIPPTSFARKKVVMVRGSGVNLNTYTYHPEPTGLPRVILAARLLKDKGIQEFIAAATLLKVRGIKARFCIVGERDPGNPNSITAEELTQWDSQSVVEFLGFQDDIASIFKNANIVVLPSYREGLPKVLQEAAACGRAVITTDVPGCRDAIEPNVTGLLVPVKNKEYLADAMERLIVDKSLRVKLGLAGLDLANREFSVDKIIQTHLSVYAQLEESLS